MLDFNGQPVASGVYLYTATIKAASGKVNKQIGKLALVRGKGIAAPPVITTTDTVGEISGTKPNWTGCPPGTIANPCDEQNNGDLTIATSAGAAWSKFDSVNQRLGVGTTTPAASLHVFGSFNPLELIESPSTGIAPKIQFKNVGGNQWHFGAFGAIDKFSIASTGNQDYIIVDRSTASCTPANACIEFLGGNVGIGTSNPSEKLHIVGGNLQIGTGASAIRTFVGDPSIQFADTSGGFNATLFRDSANNFPDRSSRCRRHIFRTFAFQHK